MYYVWLVLVTETRGRGEEHCSSILTSIPETKDTSKMVGNTLNTRAERTKLMPLRGREGGREGGRERGREERKKEHEHTGYKTAIKELVQS